MHIKYLFMDTNTTFTPDWSAASSSPGCVSAADRPSCAGALLLSSSAPPPAPEAPPSSGVPCLPPSPASFFPAATVSTVRLRGGDFVCKTRWLAFHKDSVLYVNVSPVPSSCPVDCICTQLLFPIAPLNNNTVLRIYQHSVIAYVVLLKKKSSASRITSSEPVFLYCRDY